jgi:hypothetical protein
MNGHALSLESREMRAQNEKGGPCVHGPPRAFEEKDEEVEIEDLKRAKS